MCLSIYECVKAPYQHGLNHLQSSWEGRSVSVIKSGLEAILGALELIPVVNLVVYLIEKVLTMCFCSPSTEIDPLSPRISNHPNDDDENEKTDEEHEIPFVDRPVTPPPPEHSPTNVGLGNGYYLPLPDEFAAEEISQT